MKKCLALVAMLAACGGSADISKFVGTWTGTESVVVDCGGSASTANSNISITFAAGSGSDLQYVSNNGCTFKFSVSADGTNAVLSNAPVVCSTTSNGTALQITFTSYAMTTSDGHHLTSASAGSVSSGGQTCSLTGTGTATR